jgi:hypothetical protein
MQTLKNPLILITIFGITMGYLESSVVVYLRELYCPAGTLFPMAAMKPDIIITELFREAATIIMLLMAGFLTGRKFVTGFAWFIYSFAVWDIFYYIFLKLLLNWPGSLMTWDILFMIPTLWTGPVLAPVITSLSMIILGIGIIYFNKKDNDTMIKNTEWLLLITGSLIIIVAFSWDYSSFMLEKYYLKDLLRYNHNSSIVSYSMTYVPRTFNWFIFITGQAIISGAIAMFFMRNKKEFNK